MSSKNQVKSPEPRAQMLLDAVVDYAIFMLNTDGTIASWNPGAQKIKGYTEAEVLGRHFRTFFTDEDRARDLPGHILARARENGRYETEGWRVRKDGTRFWALVVVDAIFDEAGTLIGFAKITRDITERRNAELALLESERRFRLLVEGVTDYAIYMLDPNGIITNWNTGAQRIKGYSADDIIGQHFSKFYTPDDRDAAIPQYALRRAEFEGRFEAEGWRVRKDGTWFWASVVIDSIRDEAGKLIGFAKITRDITERREAQKRLEETQIRLAQAQKLEALGQLTGGIAHDFNNLLTIIMGNLDLLRRATPERQPRLIDNALHAVEQARRLTDQLLAFGRRQALKPEVLDINEQISSMRDMLAQSLRGDIQVDLDLAEGLWPVEVDGAQLQVALINLAVNARDAMPSGGVFRVATKNTVVQEQQPVEGVTIEVSDTGTGMPPEILARVFEPFFTTKEVGKGTGLGLPQVYGFARQSHGSVDIRSEVGRGTTVALFLPRAGDPAAPREPTAQAREMRRRKARILLVEDNAHIAELARALLMEKGHQVEAVGSVVEALQRLNAGRQFDLIFSDFVMPGGMNGLDLARTVRVRWPHLPVLLSTGYSEATTKAHAEGFAIVLKPYTPEALDRAVQDTLCNAEAQCDLAQASGNQSQS